MTSAPKIQFSFSKKRKAESGSNATSGGDGVIYKTGGGDNIITVNNSNNEISNNSSSNVVESSISEENANATESASLSATTANYQSDSACTTKMATFNMATIHSPKQAKRKKRNTNKNVFRMDDDGGGGDDDGVHKERKLLSLGDLQDDPNKDIDTDQLVPQQGKIGEDLDLLRKEMIDEEKESTSSICSASSIPSTTTIPRTESSAISDEESKEIYATGNDDKSTDVEMKDVSNNNNMNNINSSATSPTTKAQKSSAQQQQQHESKQSIETASKSNETVKETPSNQQQSDQQHQHQQPSPPKQPYQPSGWRVKLYLLNVDGSWDDCGTGRICLISKKRASTNITNNKSGVEISIGGGHNNNNNNPPKMENMHQPQTQKEFLMKQQQIEEEIYHILGEPTLFMHAEVQSKKSQNDANSGSDSTTTFTTSVGATKMLQVLLRTRVLLRESYQRQGENIITWCEPYFAKSGAGKINNTALQQQKQQHGDNNNKDSSDQQQLQHVDLALSFQDNAGCLDIWNKISNIQVKAIELFEEKNNVLSSTASLNTSTIINSTSSALSSSPNRQGDTPMKLSTSMAQSNQDGISIGSGSGISAASIEPERLCILQASNGSASPPPGDGQNNDVSNNSWNTTTNSQGASGAVSQDNKNDVCMIKYDVDENDHQRFIEAEAAAVSMAAQFVGNGGHLNQNDHLHQEGQNSNQILKHLDDFEPEDSNMVVNAQLPNPPKLSNLEVIADVIAAAQLQQREAISMFISLSNFAYLKALLALFPSAETEDDYNTLATLASIIKTIFLFNDPSIIQLVASDGKIFEDCCCCLEYDPDLRSKANHRWFIRDRLKFRTIVFMEDEELVETIHKSFRVTYIRDTLLRPTMDESSLTTLGSLLTFTHADVVKGVMCAPDPSRNKSMKSSQSYLVQVLRMLGNEVRAIREIEWQMIDPNSSNIESESTSSIEGNSFSRSNSYESPDKPWKQHLAPQDNSLQSRKIRRRGCLSFLRELFNMVRMSLQQSDKDDFYNLLVFMDVELHDNTTTSGPPLVSAKSSQTVHLLSLLGAILSDVNSDVSERGACLEILSVIAMFDASLIQKHCLVEFSSAENLGDSNKQKDRSSAIFGRPQPDHNHNIIFACPPNDLLFSLLFLMSVEHDAGVMLQTSEIMRIILDTEMLNEACQLNGAAVIDNEDEFPVGRGNGSFQFGSSTTHGGAGGGSEQNSFLQMFYDHYVPWFIAPFQYSTLICRSAIPFSIMSENDDKLPKVLEFLTKKPKIFFQEIPLSSLRLSFSVELLGFCVRAHCFRMKRYLLSTKVLPQVMKLLNPKSYERIADGDRCLKLAVLRCLRSILSLKDDFYNRYIIQNNLFASVFEAFRANPVGDNLVSSSIIEMCDYIRNENMRIVIEHVVTKHLSQQTTSTTNDTIAKATPSLEDVATPYVNTLTLLRRKYEENMSEIKADSIESPTSNVYYNGDEQIMQNEKAREDQRKFREADVEESYFFDDMDNSTEQPHVRPPSPAPINPSSRNGINI